MHAATNPYCQTRCKALPPFTIASADAAIATARTGMTGSKYRSCWLENSQNKNTIPATTEPIFASIGRSNFQRPQTKIGKPNKNGTRDYGICQFNDGKNAKGVPFWIGKGAAFASVEEVLNNPEKCVRVMIKTYKAGHIGWWYGHAGYSPEAAKASSMWKLV